MQGGYVNHGDFCLEGLSHVWSDLHSYPVVFRCPRRAYQPQPTAQGMQHPHQATAILSYLPADEEEVKKIAPPSAQTMEILEFVNLADVDPLYYETSYLAVPEEPGRKPYQLLVKTMEETKRAAIRKVAEYGQTDGVQVKPEEIKLATQLVESLVADFEPQKYHDEYQERLKALLDAKLKGQEVTTAPQPQLAPVIDMMEALKKSLAAREAVPKKPPVRALEAVGGEETAEVAEKKVRKRVSR